MKLQKNPSVKDQKSISKVKTTTMSLNFLTLNHIGRVTCVPSSLQKKQIGLTTAYFCFKATISSLYLSNLT